MDKLLHAFMGYSAGAFARGVFDTGTKTTLVLVLALGVAREVTHPPADGWDIAATVAGGVLPAFTPREARAVVDGEMRRVRRAIQKAERAWCDSARAGLAVGTVTDMAVRCRPRGR